MSNKIKLQLISDGLIDASVPSPLAGEGVNDSYHCFSPSPLAGEGGISARGTSARNSGEGCKFG